MSLLVSDEPLATRLMCSRSRGEREGGPAHVTSALLALLSGERHEAEMALLRARSETHAAIECLIEVAWAFLLIETGHPWRGAVHAASARQSEGFSADGGDDFLLRILEAQAQGHAPDAEHARLQLAAKTRRAIPDGTRHAALRAYASLVAAALAFDAGDADAAEAELAAGDTRPTGSSGLLGARADLLQARIAFARGNADEQAIRDLARAIDRLALLGAQRDLGFAYRVRATCGTRDASERAAIRQWGLQLNAIIQEDALAAGVDAVDVFPFFVGHEPCGPSGEWVHFVPLSDLAGAFHPTPGGQAEMALILACYLYTYPTTPTTGLRAIFSPPGQ